MIVEYHEYVISVLRSALLLPLPGVKTRLSRYRLQVKVADQWSNVGKKTRVVKEGFELIEEEVEESEKRKAQEKK